METDPDRQRVEAMTTQVAELQALLAATVAAHPQLAARLSALQDCHAAHHAALVSDAVPAPLGSGSPTPEPRPAPTDGPGGGSHHPPDPRRPHRHAA